MDTPMDTPKDTPRHRAPAHLSDEVWRTLIRRQLPRLQANACTEFLEGFHKSGLDPTTMPRHRDLSRKLHDTAGWHIETVPGLIPAEDFFALLRDRRFPSPEWIRHPDDLTYTPEPDLFHDVFGHVPQLCSPVLSDIVSALAEMAQGTKGEALDQVERAYWFTVEFGIVRQAEQLRAFGAGLASSIAELDVAVNGTGVRRVPFAVDLARETVFDPHHPQTIYMVASSLPRLARDLAREAQGGPQPEPAPDA